MRLKAVEDVLATDPDNIKANQTLGELIYDTLNSRHEGAVLPDNEAELEKRMVNAFNKAFAGKSDTIISQIFLSDHFSNKVQRVNDKRSQHAKSIASKAKPTPEDLKKRADLDKELSDVFEQMRVPAEKAADFYSKHGNLDAREKQNYKRMVSYLSDIFGNKKINAKGKPADQAKYAAEEKKWNDLYDSIH
ncbi:MAG: hypothetical protein IPM85_11955 [Chitinophagaceae bacterium]|nr:hypothetical protein [Chitinophagaceae bacterium]